jgi:NH3-dependent NAD+ synthetase
MPSQLDYGESPCFNCLQRGLINSQEEFIGKEIKRIREICGPKGRVIGAVSGGVDSTVASKLMHEAIGDRYVVTLEISSTT